jgi:hypothetical protein
VRWCSWYIQGGPWNDDSYVYCLKITVLLKLINSILFSDTWFLRKYLVIKNIFNVPTVKFSLCLQTTHHISNNSAKKTLINELHSFTVIVLSCEVFVWPLCEDLSRGLKLGPKGVHGCLYLRNFAWNRAVRKCLMQEVQGSPGSVGMWPHPHEPLCLHLNPFPTREVNSQFLSHQDFILCWLYVQKIWDHSTHDFRVHTTLWPCHHEVPILAVGESFL